METTALVFNDRNVETALGTTVAVDQKDVTKLASEINLNPRDPSSVISIGSAAQKASAEIGAKLLENVRVNDVGDVGNLLGTLATKCRGIDVSKMQPSAMDKVRRLPFVGGLFGGVQDFAAGFHNTNNELKVIVDQLSGARKTILQDVQSLNQLFDHNSKVLGELQTWIAVGQAKLKELDEVVEKAKNDPTADPQDLRDLVSLRERLDRHIHDLELTAEIRRQNAPKIRIIQDGNIVMAEKLQSSILNTVPLWQENVAMVITQVRQAKAVEIQNSVDDTTNALLKASSDMLHTSSVAIAKANTRGIVDITTLQHMQSKLLATISEVKAINTKMVDDRASARQSLQTMANERARI